MTKTEGERIARYSRGNMIVALAVALMMTLGAGFSVPEIHRTHYSTRRMPYIPYVSEGLIVGFGLYTAGFAAWISCLLFVCARRGLTAISVSEGVLQVSVLKTHRLPLENVRQVQVHKQKTEWSPGHSRKLSVHPWDAKPIWTPAILFRTPMVEVVRRLEELGVNVVERRPSDVDMS